MEKIYFYIEDCNGGLYADAEYMENEFDPSWQSLICVGTREEIDDYLSWDSNRNPDLYLDDKTND